jgi:hypothetical protein
MIGIGYQKSRVLLVEGRWALPVLGLPGRLKVLAQSSRIWEQSAIRNLDNMQQGLIEKTGICVPAAPERRLVDFLETILAGLGSDQTVGEAFTRDQLTELAAKLKLTHSDWSRLYCAIRELKQSQPR